LGSFRQSERNTVSAPAIHNQPPKGLHGVRNDFGKPGYGGPCPPKGHGTLAISRPIVDLKPASSASDVLKTAEAYAIQRAELVGTLPTLNDSRTSDGIPVLNRISGTQRLLAHRCRTAP
jgi:phosphatidylethanolamine-binding protein (PEBP) family uncharacterized protein